MSRTDDLRSSVGPLWEKTVFHPFVTELGDGTLPVSVFRTYFEQDHLFLKSWIALMCAGIARAPDFDGARPLAAFVHLALGGEEGLFQEYFREEGMAQEQVRRLERLPTTLAYCTYLDKVAHEGSYHQIITALLGIEWPYLDWGKWLAGQGKRPDNKYYQTWIDLHAGPDLEGFVTWMRRTLDDAEVADGSGLEEVFGAVLRYEYLFWEMAYRGEEWPK